jgi:hypothetical protein
VYATDRLQQHTQKVTLTARLTKKLASTFSKRRLMLEQISLSRSCFMTQIDFSYGLIKFEKKVSSSSYVYFYFLIGQRHHCAHHTRHHAHSDLFFIFALDQIMWSQSSPLHHGHPPAYLREYSNEAAHSILIGK